jgi:hypothetical protein
VHHLDELVKTSVGLKPLFSFKEPNVRLDGEEMSTNQVEVHFDLEPLLFDSLRVVELIHDQVENFSVI